MAGEIVVSTKTVKASKDELRSFLAHQFGKCLVPDNFVFVAGLPRSSTSRRYESEV